ncbi:type II toxin-antitoxin system RelE/ParE family toxin [Aliirhizobium terrae]|uniref:type II toxin-antitoxin system RelE/ParE family toxin n=1 Tax=Terrirhizobium terrae TaxID=2926709 RepID=UPI002574ED48|nr:type II toxin-antitoxin system RelE/ParE family toxin [Rhizobium sp. CC-CFT758]WJH41218.1 type II toxin-antitoxin system RelE/ParE family toxin [Rhizobium sp. CC-CFT758]
MKVIFTREARQDLAGIARYLADRNPRRARSYVEQLRAACLQIGQMPNAFEMVEDASLPDIRRRVFEPYLIFYSVEHNGVHLLRIIHGARDYLQILDRERRI